jgi:D-3-phosphoglycerate dehydrogenase
MARVLVIDNFPKEHLDALGRLGLVVDYRPQLSADELPSVLESDHSIAVLIARSKEVRRAAIERGRALGLIVRAGAGVNTIDVAAASERGVYVANCPGKNAIAVAELAMGLLISLDRRIPDGVADLRRGVWNKKEYGKAEGLAGRALGVVGLGAIGLEVVRRARAFQMRVVAWSRSLDEKRAAALGVEMAPSVPELFGRVDAVSLHLPLTKETRGIVGEAALARLRPGALFVNTARAEIVDAAALQRALDEKRLRAALDVFHDEPAGGTGEFADPIGRHPLVYGTHHIGASTEEAQRAVADEAVRIVASYLHEGVVPSCVNLARRTPATYRLTVRHVDQVGVLAEVLTEIRRHALNVEEMENRIFDGARAAAATIRLSARPPEELLAAIRAQPHIIHVEVMEL